MDDKLLRQNVIDELDFDPSIQAANIGVAVTHGVVTLSGHVSNYAQKIAAENAAKRVKAVRAIAQEIEVRYPDEKKIADDQIAQRALAIINWDARIPADAIEVKVQQGRVTLAGEAHWHYQRAAAEAAVRKLSGVAGVSNLIHVKPLAQPQDAGGKILDALKRNAHLDVSEIQVVVHDDRVTLIGRVKSWQDRDAAERAAWSVPGVAAVEDRLYLE